MKPQCKHGDLCIPTATATAKSLQSCLTLWDPIDGSPPGSPGPEILQARTLDRVAISFSSAGKWKVKVKLLSRVRLLVTPWTALPSMVFSRQEYWSGVPLPSPNLNLIMRGKKKTPSKLKLKDSRENNWPVLIKKCHWHERLDRTKLSQVRGDWGGVKIKCYVVSRTSGGLVTKSCLTLVTPWTEPTRLLCP